MREDTICNSLKNKRSSRKKILRNNYRIKFQYKKILFLLLSNKILIYKRLFIRILRFLIIKERILLLRLKNLRISQIKLIHKKLKNLIYSNITNLKNRKRINHSMLQLKMIKRKLALFNPKVNTKVMLMTLMKTLQRLQKFKSKKR